MSRCDCCHEEGKVADFTHLGLGMICMACFAKGIMAGECLHEDEEVTLEEYLQWLKDAGEARPEERNELAATIASLTEAVQEQYRYVQGLLSDGWEPWVLYAWLLETLTREDKDTVTGLAVAAIVVGAIELQVREAMGDTEEL